MIGHLRIICSKREGGQGVVDIFALFAQKCEGAQYSEDSHPLTPGHLRQKSFRFHNKVRLECNRHGVTSHGQACHDHIT